MNEAIHYLKSKGKPFMSVKYCRTISMGKFPRLPLRRSLRKSSWELLYDRLHFSSQFLWDGEGLYPANFLLCCKIEWYSLSWNLHPTQLNIIIWIQFRCIMQLFFSFFFFASPVNFIRRGVFAHPCFVASYFFFFWTIFVSQNFIVNRQLYTLFVWGKRAWSTKLQ